MLSTGAEIHNSDPLALGLTRHLRIDRAAARTQAAERRAQWDAALGISERWSQLKAFRASALAEVGPAPPASTMIGTKVGLCLLVDFDDDPATIPQAEIVEFCNGDIYNGYGNNGSVKKYFQDVSNGRLTYSNVVTVYVRIPNSLHPKSWYDDPATNCGIQANYLIRDAVSILRAMPNFTSQILPTFDALTTNSANEVIACNVFYAGGNSGRWTFGLWPHASSLGGALELSPGGKRIRRYQITNIGSQLELGTFCHENGHLLCGFPDLYDYDFDSSGAGRYCLMAYGGQGGNPVQVSAYLKRAAGWASTIDFDSSALLTGVVSSVPGTNFNRFYRYPRPGVPTEYFLVEARHQSGRDLYVPAEGVLVWHVDELGHQSIQSRTPNSSHLNYELTLVQADNRWDLELNQNFGDSHDAFYEDNPFGPKSISDISEPGTRWWDGTQSGLILGGFSIAGETMTFSAGPQPPSILTHPSSQTVPVGSYVEMRVGAAGSVPLAFRWVRNGVNVPGATNAQLVFSTVSTNDAGSYFVVITNAFGSVTSAVADLLVTGSETVLVWRTHFNGSGNGLDRPGVARLDSVGNLYIAGESCDGTNLSLLAAKYSPAGALLWTRRFNGASGETVPRAAALDSSGNFYIAADSASGAGDTDVVLWKLAANGASLWANRLQLVEWHGPGCSDHVVGIGLDNDGNLYVGATGEESGARDVMLAKYTSSGVLAWTRRYNGIGQGNDTLRGLAVEPSSGNLYCMADITDALGSTRYAFFKFSSSGGLLWIHYHSETNALASGTSAVLLAQDAGIYFSGYSGQRLAAWKYTSSGDLVWFSRYNGPPSSSSSHSAAVDLFGNVTVAAPQQVVHFTRLGVLDWSARLHHQAAYAPAPVLAVDESQATFLRTAEWRSPGSSSNLLLTRFEPNGSRSWSEFTGVSNTTENTAIALVVSNRAAYTADVTVGPSGTVDFFAAKYLTNGARGPSITTVSPHRLVSEGATVTMSVTAGGTGLGYQWFLNGEAVAGATNATLPVIASVDAAGSYSAEDRDTNGVASVTPEMLLGVAARPLDEYAIPGQNVRLRVQVAGILPSSVRWKFGGNIVGTEAELHLTDVTTAVAGLYTVELEDGSGGTQTVSLRLVVTGQLESTWTLSSTNVSLSEIACDHIGNVVVLGSSNLYLSLVVYGTNGGFINSRSENVFIAAYGDDRLRTDDEGRIYVQTSPYGLSVLTDCYAPLATSLEWRDEFSTGQRSLAEALEIDNIGNAYVLGYGYQGTSYRRTSVAAYRATPTNRIDLFQVAAFGYGGDPAPTARGLALVSTNDVAVLWDFAETNMIVRTSRDGVPRWTNTLVRAGERLLLRVLKADAQGNLLAAGRADLKHRYVAGKWDSAGNLLWLSWFSGNTNSPSTGGGLGVTDAVVDTRGNFIVTGQGGTVKFSPSGSLLWSSPWQGEALKLDAADNAYIVGRAPGESHDSIAKLTTNGVMRWRAFHRNGNAAASINSFDVEPGGVVYLGGTEFEPWPEPSYVRGRMYLTRIVEDETKVGIDLGVIPSVIEQAYGNAVQVTISVTPPGGYSYQWLRDGTPLQGMTNESLQIPFFQAQHVGAYSLVVQSETAYVVSPEIWLTAAPVLVQPEYDPTSQVRSFGFMADSRYSYEVQATENLTTWAARASYHGTNGPVRFFERRTNAAPEFYRLLMKR